MTDETEPERPGRDTASRARAIPDEELQRQLADAERAVVNLRDQLRAAIAWRDALDAEKDRRSVQRRA
jgi:hypothetical protein